jgi:hypothetical protein
MEEGLALLGDEDLEKSAPAHLVDYVLGCGRRSRPSIGPKSQRRARCFDGSIYSVDGGGTAGSVSCSFISKDAGEQSLHS